uniref:Immunoglobulin domain protein n=1 Tax=Angiostrongylus cantonensis TaxID=6313 RepID=A0A158P8N6_ANGCA
MIRVDCARFVLVSIIIGPPKLLEQPPEEVWYQLDENLSPQASPILRCHASDNAESLVMEVGGDIEWIRAGQSGTIQFVRPRRTHEGYYQCFVSNIFGTAVSNKVHLRLGELEHFPPRPVRRIEVMEGDSLTIECTPPRGTPPPTLFWLYRFDHGSVIETIRRRHITVDGDGKLQFTSVELDDGRPNLVYECAAGSPVLHGEYRSGDHVQLVVTPTEGNKTVAVHKLYVSPDEVTVKAGAKLRLMCIFGGRPLPTVYWSKPDGNLPKTRLKDLTSVESEFGKALIVENVHPEDAGHYECRAGQITHTVNVRVLAAPYWDFDPPKDIVQPEESTTELECLASGRPAPIVRWSMNGKPLHELDEDPRRVLLDNGRVLRLSSLNHDLDTGVYQCNASNPLGYVYANAFVNVKAHAPYFLMPTHRLWKAVLRTSVAMNCEVQAAPDPVVRWVDTDDIPLRVIEGKTQLLPNNTFIIHDLNSADEGLYYCNVSNKYGIGRATNRLLVYKPTYFVKIPSPQKLTMEAGHSAELHCEAVADPRLSVQYKWTINGKIITESDVFSILPNGLRINSARGRHSGVIDCAAITDVDVKLASMRLIVKDVPAHPIMDPPICTERKAVIKWQAADEHGDQIKRYIVEMQTDFKKNIWERVVEETNVAKTTFEADVTLTPWVGAIQNVMETVSCQTRPSFPYTNPVGVRADGTEADNLVVYWEPMDKYYWNAPNLQYLVRYKLDEPHLAWTEFVVEDPLANHTIIRGQPTFRAFLVQVRAVNAMGPSILEPETVKGFSGEDVPDSPPNSFRVEKVVNFSSVSFAWEPVDEQTVNGFFRGYEPLHPQEYPKIQLITRLHANSNYTAVIRTRNRRHASAPSPPVHVTTSEGVPSKVHNLRVFAVGAHSILVMWEPPKYPNGKIRGYFLSFVNDRNETEETFVLHRQLSYLHEKSEADTPYKVSVWGETSAGEGERTMRPVRTWPSRNPDPPSFLVTNITMDSVDIEWKPSNRSVWKMPGSSFYVNYTLEGELISDDLKSLRNAAWFVAVLCAVAIALLSVLITCCCETRRARHYAVRRKEMEIGHQLENDEERQFLEYQYGYKS